MKNGRAATWTGLHGIAAAVMMAAAPALADVKAGADAWNRGDYARAIAEWRAPALAGDADAQFDLGQAYKLGRGVPVDLSQAEIWYQKAAVQGHTQAQDNYGLALFQDGRKADALPWLEKSAARDERRTELVLGTMLFNGDAIAKDWVRAYALVSRSSQQGLPQASQTLAQMDGYLSPDQRQQGIALAGRIADDGRSAQLAALDRSTAVHIGGERGNSVPMAKVRPRPGFVSTIDLPSSAAPARHPGAVVREGQGSSPSSAEKVAPARNHTPAAPPSPHETASATSPTGARAQPPVASGGRWKVQLGAFRDEGNARALWSRIAGRVGGRPLYVKAGGLTRLQAGPFASKADAEHACHAAGAGCKVIP